MHHAHKVSAGVAGDRRIGRDTVELIGDLLPLLDFLTVLFAARVATLLYAASMASSVPATGIVDGGGRAALAAAVLASIMLCDREFVALAARGHAAALLRCYSARLAMFVGAVLLIGLASRSLASLPPAWLMLWLGGALGVTTLTRVLLVGAVRQLERRGLLVETVAVVGAGPLADQLITQLRSAGRSRVQILGVFDDRAAGRAGGAMPPCGSVGDLLEAGKSRPPDWILLALPAAAHHRVRQLVDRLKALAVPIGLRAEPPVLPPEWRRRAERPALEVALPRWILALRHLPVAALGHFLDVALRRASRRPRPLTVAVDDYDVARFAEVAAQFGMSRFGYVVTPNADHLIRLHQDKAFREMYAEAAYILFDSRFLAHLLRFRRRLPLPVCTGSDLTAKLLGDVALPDDRLVLVGGSSASAARLAQRYGLKRLAHFDPPMGLSQDAAAIDACIRFVEACSPFRFCLLAVGAPQQEHLAFQLKTRGVARGLTLCIGGSIGFLAGTERRAMPWLQHLGMEWLFRLIQSPGRMAGRYLVRGPRVFGLLRRTRIVLRRPAPLRAPPRPQLQPAPAPEGTRIVALPPPRQGGAQAEPRPGS
jgi:exopolysaccharide biosynthesis WecB/TagA/CpsF family protein